MTEKRFKKWTMPIIQERTLHPKYHFLVHHVDNLELGENTDIGAFTYINAQYGVAIEKDVQIGSHCSIYSLSTIDKKQGQVTIKENARVGTHSTVMPGVTIGKNAIVGAYSFVNKDVPNDTIAYGVPVKIKRKSKT
ncbi:MAG: acyltransferase [Candidatus Thermoplasmatota archaeon]|nr:acyltransferase [Candidatus Thermoplasmatota archaeon]